MKTFLLAVTILLLCQTAYAERTTGNHIACLSKEKLSEFVRASVKNDKDGMMYLLKKGQCIVTKAGLRISVLDRSWTVSKVRIYLGNDAVVVWTPNENISD